MAQTIEQLLIDLKLNTASVGPQLADLNSKMSRSMAGVESALGKARTAFASLGVALSAGVFVRFIGSQIEAADQMGKLAQGAGVNVRAFSALAFAADLGGVKTEELASNLGRLSARLVDAQQGNKQFAAMFRELGVSAGTSADAALLKIADRFAAMPDGVQKTALALELFGKSGAAMIPLLNSGSAGIQQMTLEAQRAGKVISADFARSSEIFNDNLRKLTFAGQGFGNVIAQAVLPQVNSLGGSLFQIATRPELKGGLQKLLQFDPLPILNPLRQVNAILAAVSGNAQEFRNAMRGLIGLGPEAAGGTPFNRFRDVAAPLLGARAVPGEFAGQQGKPLKLLDLVDTDQFKRFADQVPTLRRLRDSFMELDSGVVVFAADLEEVATQFADLPEKLTDFAGLRKQFVGEFGTAMQRAAPALEHLNELFRLGIINQDEFARASLQVKGSLGLLAQESDKLGTITVQAFAAIGQGFEDAILKARSFGDVLRGLAEEISRMFLRAFVTTPLFGEGGFFPTLFRGIFGGLGVPAGGGRQQGGAVLPGRAYVVGERGPELFMPHQSGMVLADASRSRSLGMGSGVVVNISVDARGADAGVEFRVLRAAGRLADVIAQGRVWQLVDRSRRGRV